MCCYLGNHCGAEAVNSRAFCAGFRFVYGSGQRVEGQRVKATLLSTGSTHTAILDLPKRREIDAVGLFYLLTLVSNVLLEI